MYELHFIFGLKAHEYHFATIINRGQGINWKGCKQANLMSQSGYNSECIPDIQYDKI